MQKTTETAPAVRRATIAIAGDDVYEDLFGVAAVLQDLMTAEGFVARVVVGLSRFAAPVPAGELVVVCSAVGEFSVAAQAGLAASVRAGAAVIFVHATAVLDPVDDDAAIALVGASYESHGPLPHDSRFRVTVDEVHPVTATIAPFDVDHEHYRLSIAADASTIAWRDAEHGAEPLLVVRQHGAGRVCYLQLGHDASVFATPAVATMVRRAAAWATETDDEMRRSA